MQDYKKSADKQRLFADFRAGRVRVLIGSSETMGTGVNVQQRLKALHHLDVPWLPSQIEQREGRIERQGNQHEEIEIFAYATLGSMDATMWQNNERKARFIEAALSGDRTIRRLEEEGGQANQFAMAKAIASGDSRLMRKAGLESEIARLQRQRAAHIDDQHAIRRQIRDATLDQAHAEARVRAITTDLARRSPTRGDEFVMEIEGRTITQRKAAGAALLTKIRLAARERAERSWTVGRIGGFDLTCAIQPSLRDGRLEPELVLERTEFVQPIGVDAETTAVGIIARLEHAIDRMDAELEEHRRRAIDAKARLAGYSRAWARRSRCRASWTTGSPSSPRSRPTWPAPKARAHGRSSTADGDAPERHRLFGQAPSLPARPLSRHDPVIAEIRRRAWNRERVERTTGANGTKRAGGMERRSDEMAAASPSVAARVRRAVRSRAVHALAPPGRDAPRGRGLPEQQGG